ncbi:MAG: hypothetical protein ACRDZX_00130, partial [Acidimicrobiales bacterium]
RLVVGSYPPVPGAPAAATVAAVRRAWSAGREVVVASPRPSAAPHVLTRVGWPLAREVAALARRYGCRELVICAQPGWPLVPPRRPRLTAWALALAMARFEHAELVVTGAPSDWGTQLAGLAPLWSRASGRYASSQALSSAMVAAGAPVTVVEPVALAPNLPAGTVGPLEPGELLLGTRARRFLGRTSRRLLGRRAPAARAWLAGVSRPVRRLFPR